MAEKESSEKKTQEHAPREYQLELLEKAIEKNIIVCLGTGTGKTFISIKLIEYLARKHNIIRSFSEGAQRTFFLVNSVPLVFQQAAAIESNTALKVMPFCGEMGVDFWSKDEWMKHFEENHVLVMTHQIYLDLLQHAKIKLAQANLLVFDECHHANKNHPFKKIMDRFADFRKEDHPRILGLTASVVGKKVKPHQIPSEIKQLERTMRCVCATASDPDVVEKYGAKPEEDIKVYRCTCPDHNDSVAKYLEHGFSSILNGIQKFLLDVKLSKGEGGVEEIIGKELSVSKSAIRECKAALDEIGVWAAYEVSKMLVEDLEKRTKRVLDSLASLFLQATLTSLREICGFYNEFKFANQSGEEIQQEYLKPKVKKLLELFLECRGNTNLCSIVFVERRYAACVVSKLINKLAESDHDFTHLSSNFVTGHGSELYGISETEMKFTEQKKKLQEFRNGKFNVLVGTSVVEEGVDIPKCNLVVMFDFPKNFRAYVQSRGRGRAKDARYVLLVEESEYEAKAQEQEMYQCVDEYLTELCKRTRGMPTDEESDDAVNIDLLEPYYTDAGAKVDMRSSVSLLYRYCSKLPCDRFTQLKPKFMTDDLGEEYQTTLQMPRNSPITGLIKGVPMPSKDQSKMTVALQACIQLHEMGELNNHLLPVQSSSESDSDVDDETDGSRHKTGTKKRLRYHKVKMPKELDGELKSASKVHVYAIKMEIVDVFEGKKSMTKKILWDRKKRVLGIVTKNKLPQLPKFFLSHQIGKVEITFESCGTHGNLKPRQFQLIDWFHGFIFSEELHFPGCLTDTGCRIVLMGSTDSELQPSPMRHECLPTKYDKIDFGEMRKLKNEVENWTGKISSNTDLIEAIVVAMYRQNKANYLVTDVKEQLNPCSQFPDQSKGRTYKEYYKNRYELDVKNDSQPLLQVVHFSSKIDCRFLKPFTDVSLKYDKERLIPELCTLKKCPQSVALRACLLPSVLYRLQNLLSMIELRNTISIEADIGIVSSNSPYASEASLEEEYSEVPYKKSKVCLLSDEDESFSDLRSDGDDIDGSRGCQNNFLSTLEKYFSPLNNSRSVPLFSLLEALTCASSSDAFDLERLEMLGDSFLKMAVSIYVYWHEDHKDEGKLTKYRGRQISNKNLFTLAWNKELPEYLKCAVLSRSTWAPPGYTLPDSFEKGARKNNVRNECNGGGSAEGPQHDKAEVTRQLIPDKSIADSVEALIGAHLTHCGYTTALQFMTWLGLKVLPQKREAHHVSSCYAEYPIPQIEIPEGEDEYRYREILRQETCEMETFQENIGYVFKNKVLLLEAFTHPTYSDNTITGSYQRLEFLGDAILDFLVTQHIYNHCSKNLTPGSLTILRSALVNNNIFATIAVEKNYQRYLKEYSPKLFNNIRDFLKIVQEYQKEFKNKVNPNPFVIAVEDGTCGIECVEAPKPLGDVFESVAGAIFVDSGLDIKTVWKVYYPMLKKFIDEYSENVPKNPVQAVYEFDSGAEFGMAKETEDGQVSCDLTFTEEKGGEIGHRVFTGVGRNKHNAKLYAAYKAMKIINENLPNCVHNHRNGR